MTSMRPGPSSGEILRASVAGITLTLGLGVPAPAVSISAGASVECPTALARAQIDAVGAATFAWLTDLTSGAHAGTHRSFEPICPDSPPLDLTRIPPISGHILALLIVPDYIEAVPLDDPWGNPYEYRLNVADPLSADVIAIRSAGSDGVYEGTTYDVRSTAGPADDLVFYNDAWVLDLPRLDPVSRQRTTVARVRDVGDALFSWIIDNVSGLSMVPSNLSEYAGSTLDMANYTPVTVDEVTDHLTTPPWIYTRCVPKFDAWDNPIEYRLNENLLGFHVAAIRSLGSDAAAEGDIYDVGIFPADERHRDIVWADGFMAREPDQSGLEIFLDSFESGALWGYWSCGPGY